MRMNKIMLLFCMLLLAANSYCKKTFSIKILNETGEAYRGLA